MRRVRLLALAAGAATVHTIVNAALLRRPDDGAPSSQPLPPHQGRPGRARPAATAGMHPVVRSVAVLIPARNEQADVMACVRTAIAQRPLPAGPAEYGPAPADRGELTFEVLVLDDASDDATATLAASAGARVLRGAPLPDGWLGKPFACAQLAAATTAEYLAFVDADVRLQPRAVAAAVAMLDQFGLDFVSPYPRLVAVGPAERLVQPMLPWTWLTLLPLRLAERSVHPSLAVAGGQFLVVRRDAYERAGGHAGVRAAVLDDVALARALRRTGARGGIVDGAVLASCRMYRGAAAVRAGYAKSAGVAVGGSVAASLGTAAALVAVWTVPFLAAVLGRSRAGWWGYAAGVVGRVVVAHTSRARVWPDVLAHPASVAIVAALTLDSVVRRRDVVWRGRLVAAA